MTHHHHPHEHHPPATRRVSFLRVSAAQRLALAAVAAALLWGAIALAIA
jgi:hypothetical protein